MVYLTKVASLRAMHLTSCFSFKSSQIVQKNKCKLFYQSQVVGLSFQPKPLHSNLLFSLYLTFIRILPPALSQYYVGIGKQILVLELSLNVESHLFDI